MTIKPSPSAAHILIVIVAIVVYFWGRITVAKRCAQSHKTATSKKMVNHHLSVDVNIHISFASMYEKAKTSNFYMYIFTATTLL